MYPLVYASLPGLRNRFSQYPQTCTVGLVAGVEPVSLDGTLEALPDAMASFGPWSNCRETPLAAVPCGGCMDAGTAAGFSVVVAGAMPARLLFVPGSDPGTCSVIDCLRLCCFGGNAPSAPMSSLCTRGRMAQKSVNH